MRDLAVLVDPSGSETIDSVSRPERKGDFSLLAGNGFSAGYTRKVHWLRIRIDAPPGRHLLLEILPPYLDDLRLFTPDGEGGYRLRRGGDLLPMSARELPSRSFVFRIDFNEDAAQTLYLRVATSSTSLIVLRAWEPIDYMGTLVTEYLLFGLYYGLLLAMLLFNLWHGHWRHDVEHRSFLVYLLTVFLFMLALNGLVAQYLAPETPAIGQHWLSSIVLIVVGVAADFYRRILAIDRNTPVMNLYFLGMIGLSVVCFGAYVAGYFTEAARVLTLAALLFPIFGIARTVTLWHHGRAGSVFLALAFGSSLISYLITALSVQGLLPGEHWQLYSFQIGALLALLAFNFSLFKRLRHIQRQRDAAVEAARQAHNERDAGNLARQRQGALIDMLTHEIKTPLSVIRLRLGENKPSQRIQDHAERAVTAIDDIVERCAYASRLDDHAISVRPVFCDLSVILAECLAQRGIERRTDIVHPETLPVTLITDPALLAILVGNVLDNASKYSPPGSRIRIEITTRCEGGYSGLVLAIANAVGGAGRPDPSQIFTKYYRAPGAQGKSGSGLGLSIAHSIAGLLGGRLRYIPDQTDIVFELWLPRSAS